MCLFQMVARCALSAGVIKPILLLLKLIQKNYNIPIAFNRCGLLSAYVATYKMSDHNNYVCLAIIKEAEGVTNW